MPAIMTEEDENAFIRFVLAGCDLHSSQLSEFLIVNCFIILSVIAVGIEAKLTSS